MLEKLANLATIFVSIAVGVLLLRGSPADRTQARQDELEIGQAAPSIDGVDYAARESTSVVVVSTTCRFCAASLPFYARLAAMPPGTVVFAGWEDAKQLREFLGVPASVPVIRAEPQQLGVGATPTLFVADRRGLVRGYWRGRLQEGQENEVIETARTLEGGL